MNPRFISRMHLFLAASVPLLALVLMLGVTTSAGPVAKNRFIGAAACESCHKAEGAGNQWHAWSEMKHSGAFANLKSERGLEVGKAEGIDEPWKADECLECHVTGFGIDKKEFKKSFDIEEGVGCESCHGPSEAHKKVRFRAAAEEEEEEEGFGDEEEEELAEYVQIPAGEMVLEPTKELCLECHNPDSPTYTHFCFYQRVDDTRHLDPRKPRTAAERDALLVCKFGDECECTPETCEDVCPIPPTKLEK